MTEICIHCYVSGRVQGVWYRATTQQKAIDLGLKGWVRNVSDGRVELIACGDEQQIRQLQAWLWQGPTHAKVDEVIVKEIAWVDFADFSVR